MRLTHPLAIMTAASVLVISAQGCTKQGKTLTALQQQQIASQPQTVAITIQGYTPPSGRVFQNVFVNNFSVKASQGQLTYMTARDGLVDSIKQSLALTYSFSTTGPNSALPYFSDLMLYLSGITSTSQNLLYCSNGSGGGVDQTKSSSNDAFSYIDSRLTGSPTEFLGLRDCEKLYIGLNPNLFDYDGDGIPDYLELRCGLNPKNPGDSNLSIAGDGVTNLQKCQEGIPIDENANSQPNKLFASQYKITVQADGSRTFAVSNIPVMNGGQDNFLAYYITELDPTTQTSYLYTAYSILKAGAAGQSFKIQFWGNDGTPTDNYNRGISLQ